MPRVCLADSAEAGFRAVHEVVAVAAVDVQIDETRREIRAAKIDAFPFRLGLIGSQDGDNAIALDNDRRAKAESIGENNNAVREECRHALEANEQRTVSVSRAEVLAIGAMTQPEPPESET